MQVESELFESGIAGKHLVVFGAIHGNEHCGPRAITRTMDRVRSGDLRIVSGSVRFVPVCNARAYERNVRQTEENLNRIFRPWPEPRSYEASLANALCALLKTNVDMLLDIHSTSAPGPMSVFVDYPSPENNAFARALGAAYIILDWPAVYANSPDSESRCTADYAHEIGAASVTVECGQHEDPESIYRAERSIVRALSHAGIINAPGEAVSEPSQVRMRLLVKKESNEDSFAKQWSHLESVPSGTLVARRADGSEIRVGEDSVIVLPKHHAQAGEEWFYLGVFEAGAH